MFPPSATVARARSIASVLGITRAANITGLDRLGIPVFAVYRPNSRSVSVSMGKGLSVDAALASGLMEAIEDHHAEEVTMPVVWSAWKELTRRHEVVEVGKLPLVPIGPFDPDLPIPWAAGTNLDSGAEVWLPYELVHTDYRYPAPEGSGCFVASTNGLASGNHLLEALVHGICEVVERDCLARWDASSAREQQGRRIDLASVTDRPCRRLLRVFAEAGLACGVWDITSDVGLPAVMCWLAESGYASTDACAVSGAGCHLAREIALQRALTEAAQARLTVISGARDDLTSREYDSEARHVQEQLVRKVLSEHEGDRAFVSVPSLATDSFDEDIEVALACLRRAGFGQVIYVDRSRPEYAIPVARVVIPGLRAPEE